MNAAQPAAAPDAAIMFCREVGWACHHLWFLGFLFAYSLIALPLFLWFKQDAGRRFIAWLAGLCDRRGGLLLFLIPLVLVQMILRPFFPAEHHWADFAYTFVFFVSGYILYADDRFTQAVRRDWPLMLAAGILSMLYFLVTAGAGVAIEWMSTPGMPQFYVGWSIFSVNGWCWTLLSCTSACATWVLRTSGCATAGKRSCPSLCSTSR